jgi:hypothetical protein
MNSIWVICTSRLILEGKIKYELHISNDTLLILQQQLLRVSTFVLECFV